MYIYNKSKKVISDLNLTKFSDHNIREVQDLEKWVINNPEMLDEDLYILTSEYDKFDKTKERLDVLALDRKGKLVVIELKLDSTGKDVDTQAIKYASYVSTFLLKDIIEICAKFKKKNIELIEKEITGFIDNADFEELSEDVRIIIVAKEFRPEITSAILWLRNYNLDIKCVKLTPFEIDKDNLGIVSQTIIPLPELAEYQIRKEKREVKKRDPGSNPRYQKRNKFWISLLEKSRHKTDLFSDNKGTTQTNLNASIPGSDFKYGYNVKKHQARVAIYIDTPDKEENERKFRKLESKKDHIENDFSNELNWEISPSTRFCKIETIVSEEYGWDDEENWDELQEEMIDTMILLDKAFKPHILSE